MRGIFDVTDEPSLSTTRCWVSMTIIKCHLCLDRFNISRGFPKTCPLSSTGTLHLGGNTLAILADLDNAIDLPLSISSAQWYIKIEVIWISAIDAEELEPIGKG